MTRKSASPPLPGCRFQMKFLCKNEILTRLFLHSDNIFTNDKDAITRQVSLDFCSQNISNVTKFPFF